DWIAGLEARFSDRFVASQGAKIRPDPEVVVVAADESSLERMADYAGRWPWPRSIHGELVEGISAQKPRAIVFDIMFFEPDIDRPEADQAFNEAVAKHPNVFFPTARNAELDPYGIPIADAQAALGAFAGPDADKDATIDFTLPRAL